MYRQYAECLSCLGHLWRKNSARNASQCWMDSTLLEESLRRLLGDPSKRDRFTLETDVTGRLLCWFSLKWREDAFRWSIFRRRWPNRTSFYRFIFVGVSITRILLVGQRSFWKSTIFSACQPRCNASLNPVHVRFAPYRCQSGRNDDQFHGSARAEQGRSPDHLLCATAPGAACDRGR